MWRLVPVVVALSTLSAATVQAAVLCQSKRSGIVKVRSACKKKELPLDLSQFGAVGPAGPPGAPGSPGPAGPPGGQGTAGVSAVAWARIDDFDMAHLDAQNSFNITQANVAAASANPGVLCFQNLPFKVHAMVATAIGSYGAAQNNQTIVTASPNAMASGCPNIGSGDFDHSAFVSGWYATPNFNGGPRAAAGEGVMVFFY
jgi:hypothetical protein